MSKERLEDLLDEFEHACRGGDYEISYQLRSEIIERAREMEGKFSRCESILSARRNAQIEAEYYNKRYREALVIISSNLPLDGREHYVSIARKALEGEE